MGTKAKIVMIKRGPQDIDSQDKAVLCKTGNNAPISPNNLDSTLEVE